ncbi:DUF4252 domain-containing protein [Lunatimonas salinarum]|uniref:DUF4252 domain-containing protein n=1 Tax=Lunatimonas salinarum TaxID=1774590 RepID=UPI001ADF19B2|nr:DUF4252 domain-containing protein [Lunatimonas salinarum]
MKKLVLLMLVFAFAQAVFGQSKSVDALYQKYKSSEDFFNLDLSGNFLGLAKSFNVTINEADQKKISQSMEKIRLFKIPGTAEVLSNEYNALKKSLQKERFEVMMEAGKRNEGVIIYGKGGARIKDIVLIVRDEDGELMVIEAVGDFDPGLISELGA